MRKRACAVCRHLKRAKFVFGVAVVWFVLTRVVNMDIDTPSRRNKQRGYPAPAFARVCVAGIRQGVGRKNVLEKQIGITFPQYYKSGDNKTLHSCDGTKLVASLMWLNSFFFIRNAWEHRHRRCFVAPWSMCLRQTCGRYR